MTSDGNNGSLPIRGVIALVILLILAGSVAAYFEFHSSDSNSQKTSQTNQKPATPTVSKPHSAVNSEMSINELGAKIKLSPELNGLTYTVTTAPSNRGDLITVQFYLKDYSDLANQCAGTSLGADHAFANLSKANASAADQPASSIMTRINGSVIVDSGSAVAPTVTCKDPQTKEQLTTLGNKLTSELKQVFQNATSL